MADMKDILARKLMMGEQEKYLQLQLAYDEGTHMGDTVDSFGDPDAEMRIYSNIDRATTILPSTSFHAI